MDDLSAVYHASPVPAEGLDALFGETKSFYAREQRLQHKFNRAGWFVGATGSLISLAAVGAVIIMLPLKQTTVKWVEVDTSTGWVGEALSATDAPKLFNDRVAYHFLRQYIEVRESYVPETDEILWRKVRAMSSADEMENYKAWRKTDLSPVKQLALAGHVIVHNINPDRILKGAKETYSCTVRFDRQVVKGATAGPNEHWIATIDFQWHPEMTMSTEDMQINYPGMQVISYKAEAQ